MERGRAGSCLCHSVYLSDLLPNIYLWFLFFNKIIFKNLNTINLPSFQTIIYLYPHFFIAIDFWANYQWTVQGFRKLPRALGLPGGLCYLNIALPPVGFVCWCVNWTSVSSWGWEGREARIRQVRNVTVFQKCVPPRALDNIYQVSIRQRCYLPITFESIHSLLLSKPKAPTPTCFSADTCLNFFPQSNTASPAIDTQLNESGIASQRWNLKKPVCSS